MKQTERTSFYNFYNNNKRLFSFPFPLENRVFMYSQKVNWLAKGHLWYWTIKSSWAAHDWDKQKKWSQTDYEMYLLLFDDFYAYKLVRLWIWSIVRLSMSNTYRLNFEKLKSDMTHNAKYRGMVQ